MNKTTWFLVGTGLAAAGAALTLRKRRVATPSVPPAFTPGYRGGTGSPLVLLHGVGGNWRAWTPVLPHLESHHEVFAPTLLGHGGAVPFDAGVAPSIDALADGVEEALDAAGVGRAHVVGNSLGGWLALELARRGRALSVVVFSPAGAWRSQWRVDSLAAGMRLSVGMIARGAPRADAIARSRSLRWLIMAGQVAYPMRVDPELLAADIRAAGVAPWVQPLLRALPTRRLDPLPADRDYPIRAVWGRADRVLPFRQFGEPMVEMLPGAEVLRPNGLGHIPMSDDPALVARLIREVTAAVDQARTPEATNG